MTLAFAASYLPTVMVPAVCLVSFAVSMALFFMYVETEA
jgi:photosystem I reaction center subunit VIII